MMRWERRQTWLLIAGASEHVVPVELDNEETGIALQLVTMLEGETWSLVVTLVSGWCHNQWSYNRDGWILFPAG